MRWLDDKVQATDYIPVHPRLAASPTDQAVSGDDCNELWESPPLRSCYTTSRDSIAFAAAPPASIILENYVHTAVEYLNQILPFLGIAAVIHGPLCQHD